MSMDPDPPTRRIPPTGAAPEPPLVEPGVPPAAVDPLLEDTLRSLRTWLALVGVVALAALALGLWALLTKEEEDDARRGASVEQVSELDGRLDDLESGLDDRATKDSVAELRSGQDDLRDQIEALEKRAEGDGDSDELQQSVDEIQQSVDDLSADVQQLEQRLEEVESRQQEQEQQAQEEPGAAP